MKQVRDEGFDYSTDCDFDCAHCPNRDECDVKDEYPQIVTMNQKQRKNKVKKLREYDCYW